MLPVLPALLPMLGTLLDKLLPDPQAAADAKLRAMELAQAGGLAELESSTRLALGQVEVNKIEAGTDRFRGGWRPAVGWICAAGLGYEVLARPLLPWLVSVLYRAVPDLPAVDNEALMTLLVGMLGLGAYRTVEKVRGAA